MHIVLQNPSYSGLKFLSDYETTNDYFYSNLAPSILIRCTSRYNFCHLISWHKPSLRLWPGTYNPTSLSNNLLYILHFMLSVFTDHIITIETWCQLHHHRVSMMSAPTSVGFHKEPISSILRSTIDQGLVSLLVPATPFLQGLDQFRLIPSNNFHLPYNVWCDFHRSLSSHFL